MDSREQSSGSVFPDDAWKSAKFCGPNGGNCVEVNLGAREVVGVRDSKPADGGVLVFGQARWGSLLEAVRAGRLARG